eukprot:2615051-Amphidinium_carterae.1
MHFRSEPHSQTFPVQATAVSLPKLHLIVGHCPCSNSQCFAFREGPESISECTAQSWRDSRGSQPVSNSLATVAVQCGQSEVLCIAADSARHCSSSRTQIIVVEKARNLWKSLQQSGRFGLAHGGWWKLCTPTVLAMHLCLVEFTHLDVVGQVQTDVVKLSRILRDKSLRSWSSVGSRLTTLGLLLESLKTAAIVIRWARPAPDVWR